MSSRTSKPKNGVLATEEGSIYASSSDAGQWLLSVPGRRPEAAEPQPAALSFLLMIAGGWVHRHQLIVIEFLQAENRLLKDRLRGRRIRFTDAERAFLARNAKAVG